MRTIGLIGGLGPESTIDYYQRLIAAYQRRVTDGSYPPMIINSLDLERIVGLVTSMKLEELARELATEIERLARAGATIGALTANTPHIVFDEVERLSPIPLVSIVRATTDAAVRARLRKPLLLGTRFTMSGKFYPDAFSRAGVSLAVPSAADQDFIHDKYMNELVRGTFADGTRRRFVDLLHRLRDEQSIDGALLAGTELPLLLRSEHVEGVPLLDTTAIHVEAILDAALAGQAD